MSEISRRSLLTGVLATAGGLAVGVPEIASAHVRPGATHTIGFDQYSLLIDGERLVVWSGEFHPFRLPSQALWLDVLQKMRASGYNAVSMYFNWSYHSPAPGSYDFTGVRDMDAALDAAAEAGLYVIARPGPYINAEVNAGGFPGWLAATSGHARTDDATYLAATDQWQGAIDAVLARHQLTNGTGTVILYQIENEYSSYLTSSTGKDYMAHLYAKARTDGITVPIFHNDKGRNGDWLPGSFTTQDSNYLYAFDGYPSASSTPPDWGYSGTVGSKASPDTPGFEAEFGGGWFDPWGGAPSGGQGYAYWRNRDNGVYERTFYLTNLANGIKLQNVYMTFGGTSWGWLPAPVVYTSYDYGAAIDEARRLTAKIPTMKQLGYFTRAVADLGKLTTAAAVSASNSSVVTYHLTNPDTGSHFYFARNDHSSDLTFTLPVGSYTVPQAGTLALNGKDMKVVVAGYAMDSQELVYTTSHLMTHAVIGGRDVVVLAGHTGDDGETVLRRTAAPTVTALSGTVASTWSPSTGDLRLNYAHSGIAVVRVAAGGTARELLVLLVDDAASATLWRPDDTAAGPVLVRGPALVRSAAITGSALALTGDTTAAADLEVWAPTAVRSVSWNGRAVATSTTASGSLLATSQLAAPPSVTLPALTSWRYATENPESAPGFADGGWTVANKSTSFSVTPVPSGQPVLFVDDYGFHYGDVWYRGSYTGTAGATSVSVAYQSGTLGMIQVWLDGVYLGAHQQPTPTSSQATQQVWSATASFPIPAALQGGGAHVLAVLARSMSHSEDGGSNDAFKSALGLTAVTFAGAAPAVTWRIQGAQGSDTLRGPLNTGGLYGERNGWHLPGFADGGWQRVTVPYADSRPGVAWYRTAFTLAVPPGVDASIGLTVTADTTKVYRALVFLNGWNVGHYINGVGPQQTFVLPTGVLQPQGTNTLAIAVTTSATAGGLGAVALTNLAAAAGGAPSLSRRGTRRRRRGPAPR